MWERVQKSIITMYEGKQPIQRPELGLLGDRLRISSTNLPTMDFARPRQSGTNIMIVYILYNS